MAWIKSRYIFCLFLLTVCSQTGKGCKKGFTKHRFKSEISPQLFKGKDVLEVTFHDCNLRKHIRLSTNDDNFGIHSNGKVFATRTQYIYSTYHFKVFAKDLTSHEKWKVPVHLVASAIPHKLVLRKHAVPTVHFQKSSMLGRQKRSMFQPITVKENDPQTQNPLAIDLRKRAVPTFHFQKKHSFSRQKRVWIIPPASIKENDPLVQNPIAVVSHGFSGESGKRRREDSRGCCQDLMGLSYWGG